MPRTRDAKGRTWTVRLRFSPWRRVIRPWAYMSGHNPRRKLSRPPAVEAPPEKEKKTSGDWVIHILLAPIAYHEAAVVVAGRGLVYLVVLPFTLAELAVLGIAGAGLAVARTAGMARCRVELTAHTDHELHSETVFLVRGRERAGELVIELAEERDGAEQSFHPAGLADDVTVRTHRSIWQPSVEWVP